MLSDELAKALAGTAAPVLLQADDEGNSYSYASGVGTFQVTRGPAYQGYSAAWTMRQLSPVTSRKI